jgi:hypothetical protein
LSWSPRVLAVVLSASLIWTSGGVAEAFQAPLASGPQSLLTPPAKLGQLTDSYNLHALNDSAAPTVILIQDLHARYRVQKNIAGILVFLSSRIGESARKQGGNTASPARALASSLPFALAVEGASGPVDDSVMALFPDQKIKAAAADYLMREGELSGAEYFGVMRGTPKLLTGVEDSRYYELHRNLFRQTWEKRRQLVETLKRIQADIQDLRPRVYSKPLKAFQAKWDAFQSGRLGVAEFWDTLGSEAKALGMEFQRPDLTQSKDIEQFWETSEAMAYMVKLQKAQTSEEKDLVQVEHDLGFLLKVANLQATEQEVRSFGPRINQFVALCHGLVENIDESGIRELISSSIDYYAFALARNKPMVENTLALKAPITVLVAGGFHTQQITDLLRAKNISYAVITPNMDSHDSEQALYEKRLSGQLLTEEEILAKGSLESDRGQFSTGLARIWSYDQGKGLAVGARIVGAGVFLTAALVASAHGADLSTHLVQFIQNNLHPLMNFTEVQNWIRHTPALLSVGLGTGGLAMAAYSSNAIRLHVPIGLFRDPFVDVRVNGPITGRSLIEAFRAKTKITIPLYISVDGKYLASDQLLPPQSQIIEISGVIPPADARYWPKELLNPRGFPGERGSKPVETVLLTLGGVAFLAGAGKAVVTGSLVLGWPVAAMIGGFLLVIGTVLSSYVQTRRYGRIEMRVSRAIAILRGQRSLGELIPDQETWAKISEAYARYLLDDQSLDSSLPALPKKERKIFERFFTAGKAAFELKIEDPEMIATVAQHLFHLDKAYDSTRKEDNHTLDRLKEIVKSKNLHVSDPLPGGLLVLATEIYRQRDVAAAGPRPDLSQEADGAPKNDAALGRAGLIDRSEGVGISQVLMITAGIGLFTAAILASGALAAGLWILSAVFLLAGGIPVIQEIRRETAAFQRQQREAQKQDSISEILEDGIRIENYAQADMVFELLERANADARIGTAQGDPSAIEFVRGLHFVRPSETVTGEKALFLSENAGPAMIRLNASDQSFEVTDFWDEVSVPWRLRLTNDYNGVIVHTPYDVDYFIGLMPYGTSVFVRAHPNTGEPGEDRHPDRGSYRTGGGLWDGLLEVLGLGAGSSEQAYQNPTEPLMDGSEKPGPDGDPERGAAWPNLALGIGGLVSGAAVLVFAPGPTRLAGIALILGGIVAWHLGNNTTDASLEEQVSAHEYLENLIADLQAAADKINPGKNAARGPAAELRKWAEEIQWSAKDRGFAAARRGLPKDIEGWQSMFKLRDAYQAFKYQASLRQPRPGLKDSHGTSPVSAAVATGGIVVSLVSLSFSLTGSAPVVGPVLVALGLVTAGVVALRDIGEKSRAQSENLSREFDHPNYRRYRETRTRLEVARRSQPLFTVVMPNPNIRNQSHTIQLDAVHYRKVSEIYASLIKTAFPNSVLLDPGQPVPSGVLDYFYARDSNRRLLSAMDPILPGETIYFDRTAPLFKTPAHAIDTSNAAMRRTVKGFTADIRQDLRRNQKGEGVVDALLSIGIPVMLSGLATLYAGLSSPRVATGILMAGVLVLLYAAFRAIAEGPAPDNVYSTANPNGPVFINPVLMQRYRAAQRLLASGSMLPIAGTEDRLVAFRNIGIYFDDPLAEPNWHGKPLFRGVHMTRGWHIEPKANNPLISELVDANNTVWAEIYYKDAPYDTRAYVNFVPNRPWVAVKPEREASLAQNGVFMALILGGGKIAALVVVAALIGVLVSLLEDQGKDSAQLPEGNPASGSNRVLLAMLGAGFTAAAAVADIAFGSTPASTLALAIGVLVLAWAMMGYRAEMRRSVPISREVIAPKVIDIYSTRDLSDRMEKLESVLTNVSNLKTRVEAVRHLNQLRSLQNGLNPSARHDAIAAADGFLKELHRPATGTQASVISQPLGLSLDDIRQIDAVFKAWLGEHSGFSRAVPGGARVIVILDSRSVRASAVLGATPREVWQELRDAGVDRGLLNELTHKIPFFIQFGGGESVSRPPPATPGALEGLEEIWQAHRALREAEIAKMLARAELGQARIRLAANPRKVALRFDRLLAQARVLEADHEVASARLELSRLMTPEQSTAKSRATNERGLWLLDSKIAVAGASLAAIGAPILISALVKGTALISGIVLGSAAVAVIGLALLTAGLINIWKDRTRERKLKDAPTLSKVKDSAQAIRSTPLATPRSNPLSSAYHMILSAVPKKLHPDQVTAEITAKRDAILGAA